ncbi:histidine--tRNA ligase [Candidatus Dojkabacteria bacterium]|nr:histidine--tRNA ligase [Candidatus Dojkabacteria bacterium]
MESKILSKQPYKGTDDWYPKDMFLRNYLFNTWSKVAKRYGYEEYDTPIIEDANLYKVKSGEELANNQLYSFVDKGGREIALRPEMTPSLARIIANKKNELTFPLRWFNIGRYYRYEKPQKGRKREFFQLNIDILGVPTIDAELEIIQFVMDVMKELKAPKDTYELRINNRYLLEYLFTNILDVDESIKPKLARALDNYLKMPLNDFKEYLKEISLRDEQITKILEYINWSLEDLKKIQNDSQGAKQLLDLFKQLTDLNVSNIKFCPYIVRGLQYYTGTVIELYDVGGDSNPRALFGGGRYDDLLEIFGEAKIPAFGLGWGDATTLDYIKTYSLEPEYTSDIDVFLCLMDDSFKKYVYPLASILRDNGLKTLVQLTPSKLSNQLKFASSKSIPWVIIIGEDEIEKGVIQLKDMVNREAFLIKKADVIQKISKIV